MVQLIFECMYQDVKHVWLDRKFGKGSVELKKSTEINTEMNVKKTGLFRIAWINVRIINTKMIVTEGKQLNTKIFSGLTLCNI